MGYIEQAIEIWNRVGVLDTRIETFDCKGKKVHALCIGEEEIELFDTFEAANKTKKYLDNQLEKLTSC